MTAAPSLMPYIDVVNNDIMGGDYYAALKDMQPLIEKESELLKLVSL